MDTYPKEGKVDIEVVSVHQLTPEVMKCAAYR